MIKGHIADKNTTNLKLGQRLSEIQNHNVCGDSCAIKKEVNWILDSFVMRELAFRSNHVKHYMSEAPNEYPIGVTK